MKSAHPFSPSCHSDPQLIEPLLVFSHALFDSLEATQLATSFDPVDYDADTSDSPFSSTIEPEAEPTPADIVEANELREKTIVYAECLGMGGFPYPAIVS